MTAGKTGRERQYSLAYVFGVEIGKFGTYSKNDISPKRIVAPPKPERFANNPLDTISLYCPTNFSMYAYPDPAPIRIVRPADQSKPLAMQTDAPIVDLLKLPALSEQGAFQKSISSQSYAESLLRPRALRALITALPARVLILSRNPWVRLRFRLLG